MLGSGALAMLCWDSGALAMLCWAPGALNGAVKLEARVATDWESTLESLIGFVSSSAESLLALSTSVTSIA